jgi:hypothetical protein
MTCLPILFDTSPVTESALLNNLILRYPTMNTLHKNCWYRVSTKHVCFSLAELNADYSYCQLQCARVLPASCCINYAAFYFLGADLTGKFNSGAENRAVNIDTQLNSGFSVCTRILRMLANRVPFRQHAVKRIFYIRGN